MRAAVITGSNGGIGSAIVQRFRSAGYRVVGLDLLGDGTDSDAFLRIDLEQLCIDECYRLQAVKDVLAAVGSAELTALVNNAAIQILGTTEQLTTADWRKTLNVNVIAPFVLAQALLTPLAAGRGSITNVGSIHASLTKPGFVAYATSKAALVGLTRSMAVEIGARVRVNAICPAAIATPMLVDGFAGRPELLDELAAHHPVGRIGRPEEVAEAALYLASDNARFVNGTALTLDGGIGARLHDPV